MADVTINDLPTLTSIDPNSDYLVVWQTATGQTAKIKINDLLSSNGASGSSIPATLHGSLGDTRALEVIKSGVWIHSAAMLGIPFVDSKISHSGLFATTSSVNGHLHPGMDIFKAAGENTVNIKGVTAVIGGDEIKVQHPQIKANDGEVTISVDANNIYLRAIGHFDYQIQVFA
tara:strand:- start:109 stop:630 length:522 start_codon:yes stop_codon:yes gene_type:complete